MSSTSWLLALLLASVALQISPDLSKARENQLLTMKLTGQPIIRTRAILASHLQFERSQTKQEEHRIHWNLEEKDYSWQDEASKYIRGNKIGDGFFSNVYEGSSITGEKVAMKVVSKKYCLEKQIMHLLEGELNILYQIPHHPNLARFLEAFDQQYEVVMVFTIAGDSNVKALYSTIPATEEEAKGIIKQVLLGAQALHRADIYHRDLKASNWMIDLASKKITIIDFGLAVKGDIPVKTLLADGYHMPESFVGTGSLPSKQDVWELGVALFSILYMKKPFGIKKKDGDLTEYKSRIKSLDYSISEEASADLKDFFKRIFQYEANRADVDELLDHAWLKNVQTP